VKQAEVGCDYQAFSVCTLLGSVPIGLGGGGEGGQLSLKLVSSRARKV